ncbi:MAG: DNA-directed RNA polymerase subunit N [Candidatus Heimdallarchaeota archaeon]|jgi:DNA-directed RNA polymerase subunit N|nr:DNA-directed RNA polymerase subunit N [Candidatus Heimdallarchaeota archaeon]MBY8994830.1 DNA-directed RNA polymerase subunit N [Candidatus Heimdallarchaeota archaeon]
MIPVRCLSCGKVVGDKYEEFERRNAAGEDPGKVLDEMGLDKYCCRRMIIAHSDLIDEFLQFEYPRKKEV